MVTLDAQGGTGGTATVSVATGSDMPKITVPERDEYEFRGYYLATDGNGKKYYNADGTSAACFDFDEPTTLYAYWRRHPLVPEFTVSFDSKGGSPVPEQIVASGSTALKSLATTEKEGYDFAGWFYLSDETSPPSEREFSFDIKIYKDYQLYAKWTPKKYEIRWLYENGELATTSRANYGELPGYPDERLFIKNGYAHIGWEPEIEVVTGPASYKATYVKQLDVYHIVSFDSQGGSAVKAVAVLNNHTLASASTPEKTGYDFAGWKKEDGSTFGFGAEAITEDIILIASWTAKEYDITWVIGDIATISTCEYGKLPKYTGSTYKDGYIFTGWNPHIQIATADIEYTAQYYEIPTHTHSYDTAKYIWNDSLTQCTAYRTCTASDCGHTEMETAAASESDDRMIATFSNTAFVRQEKVKPTPGHVHTFEITWSKDASFHWHAATCEHKGIVNDFAAHTWGSGADKDKCTMCGYEKPAPVPVDEYFTVEFNTDGAKEYIKAQRVLSGSTATKPASPSKAGYSFKGWYKSDKKTPFDFDTKITADTTIYAVWEEIPKTKFTIRWVDYNDSVLKIVQLEEGSLPDYGDTNPSRSGYIFTGWSPRIALVTGDATYKATYEAKSSGGGGGGGGSSSGGGLSVRQTPQVQGAVTGNWTYHPNTNTWTFSTGVYTYFDQWALIVNPYASAGQSAASWFYFDVQGNMLTGWQWIKGSDGIRRCYYLNPIPDNTLGACFMGPDTTPDGFTVDANGAWMVNGVVQTR